MTYEEIERFEEERFIRSRLRGLQTIQILALVLQESVSRLQYFSNHSQQYYREYDQVQANGKRRHIEKPVGGLKELQKKIADHFLEHEQFPTYLSSPARRRSIISNAAAHRNRIQAGKMDIHNFFGSCRSSSVFRLFREHGCSPEVCAVLTNILCYKGHLPTGAPSSPIMAFLSNERMFNEIYIILGPFFTRLGVWIDDLTLSCKFNNLLDKQLLGDIERILNTHGFRVSRKKSRLYQSNQPALLAGVIVMPDGKRRHQNRLHRKWYDTKEAYRSAPANSEQKARLKQVMDSLKRLEQDILKSNWRWRRRRTSNRRRFTLGN